MPEGLSHRESLGHTEHPGLWEIWEPQTGTVAAAQQKPGWECPGGLQLGPSSRVRGSEAQQTRRPQQSLFSARGASLEPSKGAQEQNVLQRRIPGEEPPAGRWRAPADAGPRASVVWLEMASFAPTGCQTRGHLVKTPMSHPGRNQSTRVSMEHFCASSQSSDPFPRLRELLNSASQVGPALPTQRPC